MKKMILLVFIGVMTLNVGAQTVTKNEKIRQLLVVTGTAKMAEQMVQMMIQNLKNNNSDVEQKFWDIFAKEVKADELIEMIVPLYDKYYSEEDIEQLTAFYQTPVGQKTIQVLPQITQESMAVGQEWGKKIAEKALAELKKQNPQPSTTTTPAKKKTRKR